MCSSTTDCDRLRLSFTYSYKYHGTRMTVSFMFCAFVLWLASGFAWWCSNDAARQDKDALTATMVG
jgi:hypothetical protein